MSETVDRKMPSSWAGNQRWRRLILWNLGLAVLAALSISRAPDRLLHAQFWAEDGELWLREAYVHGLPSLFWPRAGYLQTLSRVAASSGLLLPFTIIPLWFALVAFAVQMLPVALLLSRRGAALIPSRAARLALVLYYIGEPNSYEVYINLTNAMWHLALAAFLLIVMPKPETKIGRAADYGGLALAGLSGPLVIFLAPIACWQAAPWKAGWRTPAIRYAGLVTACAIVQLGCVVMTGGARVERLGASLKRLVHILADQIFLGGTIGIGNVFNLCGYYWWWFAVLPPLLVCLAGLAIWGAALWRGPTVFRQFTLFTTLILVSALLAPIVDSRGEWYYMQLPGGGGRYYLLPMLAWFSAFIALARKTSPWPLRILGTGLAALSIIGVVRDWHFHAMPPTNYQAAARAFDAAPRGSKVTFVENPPPWQFTLVKH